MGVKMTARGLVVGLIEDDAKQPAAPEPDKSAQEGQEKIKPRTKTAPKRGK